MVSFLNDSGRNTDDLVIEDPIGSEMARKGSFFLPTRAKQFSRTKTMKVEGKELAIACARAMDENKAEDIRILDVTGLSTMTDFLVIGSGNSMPHLKALMRDTERIVLDKHDTKPYSGEGRPETQWVILDYFDVMVHVMHIDARSKYDLENLWPEAKEVSWA